MPKRRRYSAEFKREAVALANQPGVTKAQIGRELDINPNVITRWQRELSANGSKAFLGQGVARDEEMASLSARSTGSGRSEIFYEKRQRSSRKARSEVPGDRSLPRSLSDTADVSLSQGITERLLRLV